MERAAPYPWDAEDPPKQGPPSTSPVEAYMAANTIFTTDTISASLLAIGIAG